MEALVTHRAMVPLHARWYAPLAQPVEATVQASLVRLQKVAPHEEVWRWPRVGLASTWMVRLVQTYGRRKARTLSHAGAAAELYNLRQFVGMPAARQQQRWASEATQMFRQLSKTLLTSEREQKRARSVLQRWTSHEVAAPQPESVLLLRAVTGWAVVAADISPEEHAMLDVLSVWMGLRAEESLGQSVGWANALASVGEQQLPLVDGLQDALAKLPESALGEDLLSSVFRARPFSAPRAMPVWRPLYPPAAAVGLGSTLLGEHCGAVDEALRAVVVEGSYNQTGAWLLARGGKRIRPALTLAAAQACGGDPERAIQSAALVEWLHQASLVLDDIMDGARLRRGSPTLHMATSTGSALGAFAWLLERLQQAGQALPAPMQHVLLSGARQLIEAQHEEVVRTGQVNLTIPSYYRILAGKTASLFGVSVELGACSVGASRRQVAAVKAFARYSGLAFQLVDDLLDYTGSVEGFGKKPGTDLRARKVTLPVMLLRRDLSSIDRGRLDALLEQGGATEEDVAWIQSEMASYGIAERVLLRVQAHRVRAERALSPLPSPDGVAWLMSLSQACVERIR